MFSHASIRLRFVLLIAVAVACQAGYAARQARSGPRTRVGPAGKNTRLQLPSAVTSGTERRWALVVGVGRYTDRSLQSIPFCVQDTHDLTTCLRDAGYEVRRLSDDAEQEHLKPTKNSILVQAERFLADDRIRRSDLVMVYFSGHGFPSANGAYLAASDTYRSRAELTGLKVSWLRDQLVACRAQKKILVLDACHSGAGKEAGAGQAADRIHAAARGSGMVTLASCRGSEISFELRGVPGQPDGRNSVFTYFMVQGLSGQADRDRDGEVVLSELNRYVYDSVTAWARRIGVRQTPRLDPASIEGDIALAPRRGPAVRVETAPSTIASLLVTTEPDGAEVVVAGKVVGTTPCEVILQPGSRRTTYPVEVRKAGYLPMRLRVEVSGGDRTQTGLLELVQAATVRPEPGAGAKPVAEQTSLTASPDPVGSVGGEPRRRLALVVGVGKHVDQAFMDLGNRDARIVAQALSVAGYEVVELADGASDPQRLPTRNNLVSHGTRILRREASAEDLVLIYFSGYGFLDQDTGDQYLAASDTYTDALTETAVSVRWLRELLTECPARRKVLVLDAGHAGLSGKTITLVRVQASTEGAVVVTACSMGQWAYNSSFAPNQTEGVFTHFFVEGTRGTADGNSDAATTVSELFAYTSARVAAWARDAGLSQTPTMSAEGSLGEIVLVSHHSAPQR